MWEFIYIKHFIKLFREDINGKEILIRHVEIPESYYNTISNRLTKLRGMK